MILNLKFFYEKMMIPKKQFGSFKSDTHTPSTGPYILKINICTYIYFSFLTIIILNYFTLVDGVSVSDLKLSNQFLSIYFFLTFLLLHLFSLNVWIFTFNTIIIYLFSIKK